VLLSKIYQGRLGATMSSAYLPASNLKPLVTTGPLPHDNLGPNIIACAAATWTISAIFVGLRFYTRKALLNVLGASDWLILAALLSCGGLTGSSIERMCRRAHSIIQRHG
jgi:hypothetical protein